MEEEQLRGIASQLRKPSGEYALQIAEKMNESNKLINLYTIAALKLQRKDCVLEVGMGNGFFIKEILNSAQEISYTGCDFSAEMIQEAKIRNVDYLKNGVVKLFESNIDNMPFNTKTFDKAFTINTLYFWEDNKKVLSEFYRVLKPNGTLTIAIRPKHLMATYPFTPYGFTLYSKKEVEHMLTSNNFKVTNIIEKEEPSQQISETEIAVSSLIICAQKV